MAFLFGGNAIFGRMNKRVCSLLLLGLAFTVVAKGQENFSVATGFSMLRNLSPQQTFWALGQTFQTTFHFSERQSAYAWIDYYTEGKFRNNFSAAARSPLLLPQQQSFTATGRLRYQHFSLGWKHYFRGGYAEEKQLSVYGLAGFGFLFARVRNNFSVEIDTTLYTVPVRAGEGKVRKLTFDLGLGADWPLSSSVFLFGEARTWLPASSNESPYLHNQRNVPLPLLLSAGVRVVILPLAEE